MQRGKKQEKAWDSLEMGADGKFLQPEVGGNKFLGYPSFFYSSFSFLFLFLFPLMQIRPLIQLCGV